jgi:fatty acid desaturase
MLRQPRRWTFRYPPLLTPLLLYVTAMVAAIAAWRSGHPLLVVACWLPMMQLGHMMLLAFHEAVHYHLSSRRWVNEFRGVFLGTVAFIPLSVYRHVHYFHHARLAAEEDPELWPYNKPASPRWLRVLSACIELTLGWGFTQVQFLRGILVSNKRTARLERRIALEYALLASVWALVLAAVAMRGWWEEFLIGYVVPAFGASNVHAWRKFVEHMGLRGNSAMTATRSVVPQRPVGRVLSTILLHVNYHGAHHRHARLHFHGLAKAMPQAHTADPQALPVFPSYFRALLDMLPALANPRVGGQWQLKGPQR